jgi:formyltetrahydrofolate deformylase
MPAARSAPTFILTIACPDRMGIVAAVSKFLFDKGCDITDSAQFGDRQNGTFFLRVLFASTRGHGLDELRQTFAPTAREFAMQAAFFEASRRVKTLIMVSRFGHCLNDLLYRYRSGALPIDVPVVVSNHTDFESLVTTQGIAFRHMPVTRETRDAQETALQRLIDEHGIELIVLARYMQVLSEGFCERMAGRIINIHHSFLPSFKGASPYRQAYERGVKLIGATAHYVTSDLDEGPIIEQAVERVHHGLSPEDYVAVGRDIESVVLARAVKWHAERRVLRNGSRTIVFA